MTDTYPYRPRFGFDMRIKPPKNAAQVEVRGPCAWPGCRKKGGYPAPRKRRDNINAWLCLEHVRAVNKSWNFFSDMNADEVRHYMEGNTTGHRPTWNMAANARAGFQNARAGAGRGTAFTGRGGAADPFNLFPGEATKPGRPHALSLTKPQRLALETLDLDASASLEDVKKSYKAMVKRYHPDANGGDTGAVERLRRVIKAYQTLKSSRLR